MSNAQPKRCSWVNVDQALMREYHDREWGVPAHDDRRHFEFLILEAAQAGLSWSIVLKKREGYRRAFSQFDPGEGRAILRGPDRQAYRRSRDHPEPDEIAAAVRNARAFLAVQEEFGSFDAYCWRFVDGRPRQNRWKPCARFPRRPRVRRVQPRSQAAADSASSDPP